MRDGSATRNERFLVTGSLGCIGVWVLRKLLTDGAFVVGSDVATDSPRLGLVLGDAHAARLVRAQIDVTDMAQIERALDEHEITMIIHLAALQVPFCRADPPLGAAVNVVGTVNVLEAARRRQARIPHVVYASSIAALDSADGRPGDSLPELPGTIYGVYKRADEE
jgi:nucleoside-diphosphate-sugar epimerase